jgi:hypothetical protein
MDMTPVEQTLVSYLSMIKHRKIGFMDLLTDVVGWCADISLDARYNLFTSECIFDDCNDTEARIFLAAFLADDLSVSWSVSEQLSKLLTKRGRLVSEIIDPMLQTVDWSSISCRLLFLSYLALRDDGAALASGLLDVVPEDGRDGLFLACHRICSEELDRKLMTKFMEWSEEQWSPCSTGEIYALEQFIAKWLKLYPFGDLEGVIRLYFEHRAED